MSANNPHTRPRGPGPGRLAWRRIGLWSVALLLLAHASLMATGRCATPLGSPHWGETTGQPNAIASGGAPGFATVRHPPVPAPAAPLADACPAQQAALPLLALAVHLALFGGSRGPAIPATGLAGRAPLPPPPRRPYAPRRRAILQVFVI